jgi:hypothetical protein
MLIVEWREKKQQFEFKIFLNPKWREYLNNTRPNHARSQVRWRTRWNITADRLKLYKLVAEWLCVNIRYGTVTARLR